MMGRLFFLTLFVLTECRYYLFNTGRDFGFGNLNYKPLKNGCCTEDPTKNLVSDLKPEDEIVIRTFCTDEFDAREVYSYIGYKITYKFKHNIEDSTKIGINYRAIYINLKLEGGIEAKDARILPRGLRTRDAVWRLDGKELTVTVPYEAERNVEIPLSCPRVMDNPMDIDSPLSPEYRVFTFNRFGVDLKHLQSVLENV